MSELFVNDENNIDLSTNEESSIDLEVQERTVPLDVPGSAYVINAISPTVTLTRVEGGLNITIVDKTGTHESFINDGADGQDGTDGQDGAAGVGISSVVLNSDYTLTITYTNGATHTTSSVRGEKGEQGDPGEPGSSSIDDTAGAGDTGKIWSADKTYSECSRLETLVGKAAGVEDAEESEADLYICDGMGDVIAEFKDGHIITKNFNSGNSSIELKEPSEGTADLYVTDSFGNVIAKFANGHIVTKEFDSNDYANVLDDISDLKSDVSDLQEETDGIVGRNRDVTDGVYAACRWHQPSSSAKQFCLLMGADVHGDVTRTESMVKYLNAVDAFDGAIMLGDIGAWETDASWYTNAIKDANKPFLTVVGNHDAAGNNSQDSTSYEYVHDFYEKFIEPNLPYADLSSGEHEDDNVYYYKDFTAHKIRVICVNQYDYPPDKQGDTYVYKRGKNCYGQAQITWFCNTLKDTPSDYGVIVALHSFPESMRMSTTNPDWVSTTAYGSTTSPDDIMDHSNGTWIITEIVDAWQNGTSLTKTYGYVPSGSWTSVSVDVDFSERGAGEFITYIGGHWHMSLLSEGYYHPNQKMFSMDSSSLTAATQGDVPRRAGTRSEDCICALAVDRDRKTVKLFYIGAHFTKDGINRLYGTYSYAST